MDSVLDFSSIRTDDHTPRKLITIMGIPIDVLDMDEALDRIDEFVYIGRGTGKTQQITTVNADFVVNAIKDPEIRIILQEADLATADGMPIVWASKLLGVPMGDRVAGADMVPLIAERAAQRGFSIYFLGAAPGIAEQAAEILRSRYPRFKVAGVYSPPFGPVIEMDPGIVDMIRTADPDILLVAFGNPKQEKWIAMHRYNLKVPVLMGIGGSLDFITGNTSRAPRWMQKFGLEWLHRLLQDPGRLWKRYFVDFLVFGSFMFRQWGLMKQYEAANTILPIEENMLINDVGILRVRGSLVIRNLAEFNEKAVNLISQASTLIIDFSDAIFIDSAAIATLVRFSKDIHGAQKELYLVNLSTNIRKTLELLRLDRYFSIRNSVEEVLYPAENSASNMNKEFSGNPDDTYTAHNGKSWGVIRTPNRFDAQSAKIVHTEGLRILDLNENLLVSMENTVILTTAGLAVLADLHHKAQSLDRDLMLTNVGKDPQRVIELASFDEFLHIDHRE